MLALIAIRANDNKIFDYNYDLKSSKPNLFKFTKLSNFI